MSPLASVVLAAVLLAAAGCQRPPAAGAAKNSSVVIEQVQVGFPGGPAGQESGRTRNGAWSPVYVKLKVGAGGVARDAFRVAVESTDSEDSPYLYTVPLPQLAAGDDYLAIAYVRPGSGASEVRVSLQTADGQPVQNVPRVVRDPGREVLQPRDQLYLALGNRLPGLKRALAQEQLNANLAGPPREEEADLDDRGARRLAFIDDVAHMPDRWFGYEAADTVVLTTGSENFMKQLLDAPEAPQRRRALAEWIRRGGQLVVAVGRNHQLAAAVLDQMPLPEVDKMPLLNCAIGPGVTRKNLRQLRLWAAPNVQRLDDLLNVEIAGLTPGRDVHVVVRERPEPGGDAAERPVLVQSSCGLGRVLLVGFDVDSPPFTSWPGQGNFWNRIIAELAPRVDAVPAARNNPWGGMIPGSERPEITTELRTQLETFTNIPTVSFGWVALFILFYIFLVGPLDYLILKKVVKRLELTWITFPTIVVIVSVAAYLTAYHLKGDELRVNKVDLVELDLHTPQIYGQSWFTLFSPRIQNYTVALEPAWPGGSAAITVLDDPLRAERTGSQGLFARPYEYLPDLSAVERVPIPVWATRSFNGSWRAPAPAEGLPLVADLRRARDSDILIGSIENRLPFGLEDVALFYRNAWFSVGALPAEATFRVDNLQMGRNRGQELDRWFGGPGPSAAQTLLRAALFHRHARQNSGKLNSGLRTLDQHWRLAPQAGSTDVFRDEVVLVARARQQTGASETVTAGRDATTRLWLGAVPAAGVVRPPLPGYMTQEAHVRAFLPIAPSGR